MSTSATQLFTKRYNRLNPQQRAAVDAIDGPVMVIAGPGTGKTEVLGCRIANILRQRDVRPEGILCLTYTNAGVVAMRERLVQFLGPMAYRVQVSTFHGFCNDILQHEPQRFPIQSADVITDLEQVQIMKQMITKLPPSHPLHRTGSTYEVKRLKNLFNVMKQENWTEEDIIASVESHMADLPNQKMYIAGRADKKRGYVKGDIKTHKVAEEQAKMDQLLAGAALASVYQAELTKRGLYEYADMLRFVTDAWTADDAFLGQYQEQFEYILVDEFQDTTGAQMTLLNQLTSYWDAPNIMVVGDDDQSIYRFAGANLKNITDFADQYKTELKTVVLTQNYRSSPPVLTAAEAVIVNNTERLHLQRPALGLEKNLTAAHQDRLTEQVPVQVLACKSPDHEVQVLADRICALNEAGTPLSDIAVLAKKKALLDDLEQVLAHRDVPVWRKKKFDALKSPIVQRLLELCEWAHLVRVSPKRAESLLVQQLFVPWWAHTPAEALNVLAAWRQTPRDERPPLFDYLQETPECAPMATVLIELLDTIETTSAVRFLANVLQKSGAIVWAIESAETPSPMALFQAIFDACRGFSTRKPRANLLVFLQELQLMRDEELPLDVRTTVGDHQSVQMMTVHGSKGLEFPHVFMMGMTDKAWRPFGSNGRFSFPKTLTQASADEQTEESRRLFFVGQTRAKTFLTLSYAAQKEDGTPVSPVQFLTEMTESNAAETVYPTVDDAAMNAMLMTLMPPPPPQNQWQQPSLIAASLESFALSASSVGNYLDCPVRFYFQNIVKIPAIMPPKAAYGTVIHTVLERATKGNAFPDEATLRQIIDHAFASVESAFTLEEKAHFLAAAHHYMPPFVAQYADILAGKGTSEMALYGTLPSGVRIRGRLDRVVQTADMVRVIDYKTGKHYAKDFAKPTEKNPDGGRYWRQAMLYALLTRVASERFPPTVQVEFLYVEALDQAHVVTASDADVAQFETILERVWNDIHAHRFTPGCNKKDCEWCSLLSTLHSAEA